APPPSSLYILSLHDALPICAREYSTLTNISQHALEQGHADCGQQTLLLIALLRMNGIPARWQSGWIFSDASYDSMHDWGWLYLADRKSTRLNSSHVKISYAV